MISEQTLLADMAAAFAAVAVMPHKANDDSDTARWSATIGPQLADGYSRTYAWADRPPSEGGEADQMEVTLIAEAERYVVARVRETEPDAAAEVLQGYARAFVDNIVRMIFDTAAAWAAEHYRPEAAAMLRHLLVRTDAEAALAVAGA